MTVVELHKQLFIQSEINSHQSSEKVGLKYQVQNYHCKYIQKRSKLG